MRILLIRHKLNHQERVSADADFCMAFRMKSEWHTLFGISIALLPTKPFYHRLVRHQNVPMQTVQLQHYHSRKLKAFVIEFTVSTQEYNELPSDFEERLLKTLMLGLLLSQC